jgi:hypothetical protein
MRFIKVLILREGGATEWRIIRWGKAYLDQIRKVGGTIIYHEEL